ncbi:MAG: GntR family transcriptional regulator [Actinobacteria bacterium]|nr:GntR family transcriptional regulator [Actinomycetota bacterium]
MSSTPVPVGRSAAKARTRLLDLIATGVFAPNEKLPGERELAAQLRVSRTVLREALGALAEEGQVESSPARGWFVTPRSVWDRAELLSFSEMARSRGLVAGARLLGETVRPATIEESTQLEIAPAAEVLELVRLRSLNGTPICVDRSVLALARAGGLENQDWSSASLYERLDSQCGIRVIRSDYTMHAEAASATIADQLGIGAGTPVLVGDEVAFDIAGLPVVLGQVVYRGDAYRFQATLYRRASQ